MPGSKKQWPLSKLSIPLLLVFMLSLLELDGPAARAQPASRLFPETGKTVHGLFLKYWDAHGGLPQQGFPITEEMPEKSATDGRYYTVQYFERAVFELHPQNKPPHDVLLSLLGVYLYKQKYQTQAPGQQPNTTTGSVLFRETGKRVGGAFLKYWRATGGVAQHGYPISEEFMERSELDGKSYRVQYFERAVFELHPENAGTPHEVLLSQLGTFRYRARYGSPAQAGSHTGSIVYLAPDGVTVKSIRPDGSGARTLAVIKKRADEKLDGLAADPTGASLLYSLSSTDPGKFSLAHYMLHSGQVTALPALATLPRWSADGKRFVAQLFKFDEPGQIYLYDVTSRQGRSLPAQGTPDWFPDGNRLVYTNLRNVFSFDLAAGTSTQLTRLPQDEANQWIVQEAHVLPRGDRILFYGGPELQNGQQMVGPHGEGQQWWSIPPAGGDPKPVSRFTGSGAILYAAGPIGDRFAYADVEYGGALCGSYDRVSIMDLSSSTPTLLVAPGTGLDESGTRFSSTTSLSWSPDGHQIAYGMQEHRCAAEGAAPTSSPPVIYVWNARGDAGTLVQPRGLVEGSYPIWIR